MLRLLWLLQVVQAAVMTEMPLDGQFYVVYKLAAAAAPSTPGAAVVGTAGMADVRTQICRGSCWNALVLQGS